MLYLSNSFSLGMISGDAIIQVREVTTEQVKSLLENFVSVIGHTGTAEILSRILNLEVPTNRTSIKLSEKDRLIVFQILTRLEEGRVLTAEEVASLPFKFYLVEILPEYTLEALYHW